MISESQVFNSTISELSQHIRSNEISPVDLTEIFLERIDKIDPKINSYITVAKNEALRDAARAREKIASGTFLGPLHGIPIGVKDLIATAGIRTTSGSKIFSDCVPSFDATVIERVKAAGSIILGKNNLAEFAYSTTNQNPFYGTVRNPWNLDHMTGGSSGGSAAAVAASLCCASLGTDTGGSTRIPSALCGTVGLKPTYGRISRFGVRPLSWSLDHVGIIGNSVSDVTLIFEAIAGNDTRDPTTSPKTVPKCSDKLRLGVKGVRIGVPDDYFFEKALDKDVRNSVLQGVELLKQLGANVTTVSIPYMKFSRHVAVVIMSSEASSYHEKYLKTRRDDYGSDTLRRLELGIAIPATWYLKAQRLRTYLMEEFRRSCKGVDTIITPTTPLPAPRIDQADVTYDGKRIPPTGVLPRFTSAFNLLGLPAISIPCGFSSQGLPIGMQVIGKPFDEPTILGLAYALETNSEWHRRRPGLVI